MLRTTCHVTGHVTGHVTDLVEENEIVDHHLVEPAHLVGRQLVLESHSEHARMGTPALISRNLLGIQTQ